LNLNGFGIRDTAVTEGGFGFVLSVHNQGHQLSSGNWVGFVVTLTSDEVRLCTGREIGSETNFFAIFRDTESLGRTHLRSVRHYYVFRIPYPCTKYDKT